MKTGNQYNWKVVDTILKFATKKNHRLFGNNLIRYS